MIVLGIGGSDHDASAALIIDGRLAVAIEDERLQRVKHGSKHWHSLPGRQSAEYCLKSQGLSLDDVDKVFCNEDMDSRFLDSLQDRLVLVPHHLAHAAAAYYGSGFESAAIMVVDGNGGMIRPSGETPRFETVSIGAGNGRELMLEYFETGERRLSSGSWQYFCTNSLGGFYKVVTDALGFGSRGQGKTMGLAPHGTMHLLDELQTFFDIADDGHITFDPYCGIYDWLTETIASARNAFKVRADIAAATQEIFETSLLQISKTVFNKTKNSVMCYGGGCALNCAANYRLLREGPFDDVFLFPAAGDNGLSIGAALFGYYNILGTKSIGRSRFSGNNAYLGKRYSNEETRAALDQFPVFYRQSADLFEEVAWRLSRNQVVGWFQGGSEIGPRALGNRSILATPTDVVIKEHINLNVKHRESFRPLAPVVCSEDAAEYFQLDCASPFMLLAVPVREKYRRSLAGITHVDGTARVQTVAEGDNPRLYALLQAFKKCTGYSMLINTSFNRRGEPIIESPVDALNCFCDQNLDCLIIDDLIVEKHTPWAKRTVPGVA